MAGCCSESGRRTLCTSYFMGGTSLVFAIITPSFNQGEFLAETIESVISQEGDLGIDYLIADGASTDNSSEIIRRYDRLLQQGKWPVGCRGIRLRWVNERDRGQSDALQKGFRMSEGSILAWLNFDGTCLQAQLSFWWHVSVPVCCGYLYCWDQSEVPLETSGSPYPSAPCGQERLPG